MGKSRTLVWQIGRFYRINGVDYQVVKTQDYKKKNGKFGQRVIFESVITGKKLEREQQYRLG